jgi:hypothetical protein
MSPTVGRAGRVLVGLWSVAVIAWYGRMAIAAIRDPSYPPTDLRWAAGGLAVVGLAAAADWIGRGASLGVGVLGATTAMAVLMAVRSQSMVAALVATWMFVVAAGSGTLVMRACGVRAEGPGERVVLSFAAGMTVMGSLVLAIGLLGILTPTILLVLLLGLTAVTLAAAGHDLWGLGHDALTAARSAGLPLALGCVVFTLGLSWALAPAVQFDDLNYHLAVPKTYLQRGAIVDLPYFFHSYFAHLMEAVFLPALALGGAGAVKLLVLATGMVVAGAVFVLGRLMFDSTVGRWAAVLFFTTPVVVVLCGTAHVDLGTALFVTATFIAWHHARAGPETGWSGLTAILGAAALATKLNASYALAVPGSMMLASLVARSSWRVLAWCALAFLAVAGPWFALTQAWTGNPVFPLLNGVFRSVHWDPDNRLMNAAQFGFGHSASALLALPFRFTFDTVHFGEGQPRGGAGIALLMALPWLALAGRKESAAVRPILVTGAVFLTLWAFTFQYVRYLVPFLPAVCVLAAAAARDLGRILLVPVLFQLLILPSAFWQIEERFPFSFALGRESEDSFLTRTLGGYAMAQHLNRLLPPPRRVLGEDTESVRYYLDAPLDSVSESLLDSPLRQLPDIPRHALAARLADLGYTHIFAAREAIAHPEGFNPYLDPAFLRDFTVMEASDDGTCVFRLRAGPAAPIEPR